MRFTGRPPSVYSLDEEVADRKKEESKEEDLPDPEDWKYSITPIEEVETGGRKMELIAEEDVYAGDVVRQMMEARRYRPKSYTWLGYTKDPNRGVEEVGIPHQSLFRHTAFFGTTGYGKSTVVKNLILQWMQAGWGLCFIDPKGDDSQDLLQSLPEHRREDIIWAEPGDTDREETVGFNFFDTYAEPGTQEQEEEAQQVTSDFVDLLKAELQGGRRGDDWSPQMGGVAKAIIGELVRAEEDYTIVDFYKILDSQTERDAFLDMYGENLEDIERDYVEDVDPDEIRELTQKVKSIATNKVQRQMLAYDGSAISISEIVEEGKILLMNTSNLEDEQKTVSAAIAKRIWSTIKARSDIPVDQRTPFFLCIDEFDDVTMNRDEEPNRLKIGKILSKARALRLGVLLANQQPSQLAETVQDAVYGNCDNLFTFNPGEFQDASNLAKGIGDIESRQLLELDKFKILGRVTIDGSKSPGLLINTFPEYPPIRTEEEAEELVDQSVSRYGVPKKRDTSDISQYGVVRFQQENEVEPIEFRDTEITQQHALITIIAESVAESVTIDGKSDWVSGNQIESVFTHHFADLDFNEVKANLLRPSIGELVEQTERDGVEYFRVTEEGQEYVIPSSENEEYGRLTKDALSHFSEMGYLTMYPVGTRAEVYFEGVSLPPIDPTNDAMTIKEAKQLYTALESSYPEIAERFQDKSLYLSPSVDPFTYPEEVVRSVYASGKSVTMFVVNEELLDNGKTPAETIEEMLNGDPPLLRDEKDGNRHFYMSGDGISLPNGGRALHRSTKVNWREESGDIVLEDDTGMVIARFESYKDLEQDVEATDFQYSAQPEEIDVEDDEGNIVGEERVVTVYDNTGDEPEEVDRYDSIDDAVADGYNLINRPFVPEQILDQTGAPNPDMWDILVVPDEGESYYYEEKRGKTK